LFNIHRFLFFQLDKSNSSLKRERGRIKTYKEVIKELLIEKSKADRKRAKEDSLRAQLRIGQFKPTRAGAIFKEQWVDGVAFEEIALKRQAIDKERTNSLNEAASLRKSRPAKTSKK
jgi:tousled-like kinase